MIIQSLSLKVEAKPGSDISQTSHEAVALANHLRLHIWFDFNGVQCLARVGDDPEAIDEAWRNKLAGQHKYKIAASNKGV